MTTQIIIRVESSLKNKVSRLAKAEGKNLSELVRELLEKYTKKRDIGAYIDDLWEKIDLDLSKNNIKVKKMPKVVRVVIDTNVFISSFVGSILRIHNQALERWQNYSVPISKNNRRIYRRSQQAWLERKKRNTETHKVVYGTVRQKFVIDTGATLSTIPAGTAGDLGIRIDQNNPICVFYTARGVRRAPEVNLSSIEIGQWVIHDVKVLVVNLPQQPELELLELNYLNNFRMNPYSEQGILMLEPLP